MTCDSSSISNTGPHSTNVVKCHVDNDVKVTCKNDVVVKNDSDQKAETGDAFVLTNTTGGDAGSGSASNNNQFDVELGVTGCAQAAAVAETPAAGGQGGGVANAPAAVAPVAAAPAGGHGAAAPVASLPATGSDSKVSTALISTSVLGGIAAAAQFGVQAYRRRALQ